MTTVLIVDDLGSIREFLKINLSSEPDLKVVGLADNGQRAIAQTEEHQPDIILMDINMPGEIDGIQATERIVSRFPASKILLLTSQDDKKQLERAIKAGSRGYILKNTSIKDLANIIRLAEKGFFQIGPVLGDWDGTLHNLTQATARKQETTEAGGANSIISHDFNYPLEAGQASQKYRTLPNFSSELLQLQATIKSQENTIANLTHQHSHVQQEIKEIKSKPRKERLGSAYPSGSRGKSLNSIYYGSIFTKSKSRNQRHLLFIGSFFLGAITVLFLILLLMMIG
jgi:DNA-binding NarL/FixJ family response regulator